jgi:hypothetical protein
VRLTNDTPRPAAVTAKTEPVFYNGKTYQVSFVPSPDGSGTLAIAGMGAAQSKDASGLAVSAFHHFACKDTEQARLATTPSFDGVAWHASARCVTGG